MTPCIENYRFLARYNSWMNQRLYAAAGTLGTEERQRDLGAFFGSIHGTLGHLVVADQVWLKRFAECGADHGTVFAALNSRVLDLPDSYTLDMVLFEEWSDLLAKRVQLDAAIEQWINELPDGFEQRHMRYSNSKGVSRDHPAWQAMTHFFNHQTHHRGQVTTLLTQLGVEVGTTDLIALV
jgi:uncharacterized damage-inducible protein DinB